MFTIFNLPNKSSSMNKQPHKRQKNKAKETSALASAVETHISHEEFFAQLNAEIKRRYAEI